MIKLLIGGSPCTKWSIAQKGDRETEPSGIGWELFNNYLIAKQKFKPDLFLYENNVSAADPIKVQIREELRAFEGFFYQGVDYTEINSALVSAQNRERFYVHNCGNVGQPKDRGIILRDILETDVEGIRYSLLPPDNIPICLNSKSGRGGVDGLQPSLSDRIYSIDGKHPAVTASYMTKLAEPIRIGTIESNLKNKDHHSKQYRVYSPEGKATTLCGQGGGGGAKAGLYACPARMGFTNVKYFAYEIDKYAMQVSKSNYPDIVQMGDAFDLRHPDWTIGY